MSQTFYIFRHGQTLVSKTNSTYGNTILTAEILPEGKPVIEKLGGFLKHVPTDFNVSSEFLRCRQTVEIVARLSGKQFSFDHRINELYNETLEEFISKIKDFVAEMKQKNYQNILICTHGAIIAILTELIVLGDLTNYDVTNYPCPGILRIIKDGKIHDLDFNLPDNQSI